MRLNVTKLWQQSLRLGGLCLLLTSFLNMGAAQTPIPYSEDFEDGTLGAWQSYSVKSNKDWEQGTFSGDGFATVNGFQANTNSNDWLISTRFDLSTTQDSVFFRFNNAKNFGDAGLKLLISKNYDGESNPDSNIFNWKDITNRANLVKQQGYVDTPSGRISINDFPSADSVYIAFKYTATPNSATEWQLDDFKVFQISDLAKVPYSQDFENVNGLDDWQAINLSSGNNWTRESFSGDYFAEMSGFQSDSVNRDWLISPGFDMSNINKAYFFSFTSTYDFNGDTFRVKASTNYDGQSDPTKAKFNWTDITSEFKFSQGNNNVVPSGAYNLSAFNGDTLYVAFQYTAPANDGGRMQIDDIKIQQSNPLIINEVLVNNQTINFDENGQYDSWIEIYNPNGKSVNLNNYSLSDERSNRTKYQLPDTSIPSKDYVLIWADNQNNQGDLHTNFGLDANGDNVFLTSNKLGPVDSVSFGAQNPDTSFGRFPNETGDFQPIIATPEAENERFLPEYDIGKVTSVDPQTGVVDSLGVTCKIKGIVHGFDREADGYEISIQDSTGGIGLFEFSDVSGYTPEEGQKVVIRGEIGQFNGMAQMRPDSIKTLSSNNKLFEPLVTDKLSEKTEAIRTRLENYTLVDTSDWDQLNTFNAEITNGTDTFIMRVEDPATLRNKTPALGYFDIKGEGWQYDASGKPLFDGYQIFPETVNDIVYDTNLVINEFLAVNQSGQKDQLGEQDPWIELYNKGDEPLNPSGYLVANGTNADDGIRLPDTTIQPGGRLIVWADGDVLQPGPHTNFSLSSSGGTIALATPYGDVFRLVDYGAQSPDTSYARNPEGTGSFGEATPTFDSANKNFSGINATTKVNTQVYPNPVSDVLNIKTDRAAYKLQLINGKGQVVETRQVMNSRAQVPMTNRPEGLYLIRLQGISQNWQVTKKVIHTQ